MKARACQDRSSGKTTLRVDSNIKTNRSVHVAPKITDPPYGGPHPAAGERANGSPPALAGATDGPEEDGAEEGHNHRTFIANQKHSFLESDRFTAILRAVQAQPRKFKVYEKAGTRRVSVQDVKNIQQAKAALGSVVGMSTVEQREG